MEKSAPKETKLNMVQVTVPATTANLGPGFDFLGLPLRGIENRFNVTSGADSDTFEISGHSTVDTQNLSTDPDNNLFFTAVQRFFQAIGKPAPKLNVSLEAQVPLSRGLGSSSTAIVAGLLAGNELGDKQLSNDELLQLATEIEGHPDNVAPALFQKPCLCYQDGDQVRVRHFPWPEDWKVLIVAPETELKTEEARKALKQEVSLKDAIANSSATAVLLQAVHTGDEDAMRTALKGDKLHENARKHLIPHFDTIRQIVEDKGGLGAVISGAGPSIAIFTTEDKKADILDALGEVSEQSPFLIYQSSVINSGI